MSSLWLAPTAHRRATDWKEMLPKSSTLQDLMKKVYEGAYVNGELIVHVVGAELQHIKGNPFCVLQLKSVDGTKAEGKQYKTAIVHKDVNPCYNEGFVMELSSKTEIVLWIDVRSSPMIGKDKQLGKCVLALDLLPEEAKVEKQYPLLSENDRDEIGTITLQMFFTPAIRRNMDYVMASENYDLLSKALFDKEGTLVGALCQVCNDDDLSMVLIRMFNAHGLGCNLLSNLISNELLTRGEPTTLFRIDSMATKTMRNYFHLISRKSYLNRQIMPLINEITKLTQKGGSLEVFQNNLKPGEVLEENIKNLWGVTSNLLRSILDSFDSIPGNIKKFFGVLGSIFEKKYGKLMLAPAGSLFFLRFVCPGIVFPIEFGIVQSDAINPEIYRGLLLVGKILQGVTGRVEFREDALKPFNDLVAHFSEDMDNFLKLLCSPANAGKDPNVLGPVDDPRHPYTKDELAKLLAIILRKIHINLEKVLKIRSDDNSKNVKMKEIQTLLEAVFADDKIEGVLKKKS